MQCEMCGKIVSNVKTIITEGTELQVCKDCTKFGKIKKIPKVIKQVQEIKNSFKIKNNKKQQYKKYYKSIQLDREFKLMPNYKEKIKNKRENLNLKQEDLAKKLNIKENIIHRVETGHLEPNIDLIKKLESFLHINLIDKTHDEKTAINYTNDEKTEKPTIGNMIQIKIRKRNK